MTNAVQWVKWHFDKWRGDNGLRACSLAARGLWMDLLCIMHEATPYGHLAINMKPLSERDVVQFVGSSSLKEVRKLLSELRVAGVFSETSDGVIYSRRLVRDNEIREKSRVNGSTGGNPTLKKVSEGVNPPNQGSSDLGVKLEKEIEREEEREKERKKEPSLRSGKKDAVAKGSRLADDWTPGARGAEYARKLGLVPKDVFIVFRNYWQSKAGASAIKTNWIQVWENWCLKEARQSGAKPPPAADLLTRAGSPAGYASTVSNGF